MCWLRSEAFYTVLFQMNVHGFSMCFNLNVSPMYVSLVDGVVTSAWLMFRTLQFASEGHMFGLWQLFFSSSLCLDLSIRGLL